MKLLKKVFAPKPIVYSLFTDRKDTTIWCLATHAHLSRFFNGWQARFVNSNIPGVHASLYGREAYRRRTLNEDEIFMYML